MSESEAKASFSCGCGCFGFLLEVIGVIGICYLCGCEWSRNLVLRCVREIHDTWVSPSPQSPAPCSAPSESSLGNPLFPTNREPRATNHPFDGRAFSAYLANS